MTSTSLPECGEFSAERCAGSTEDSVINTVGAEVDLTRNSSRTLYFNLVFQVQAARTHALDN